MGQAEESQSTEETLLLQKMDERGRGIQREGTMCVKTEEQERKVQHTGPHPESPTGLEHR